MYHSGHVKIESFLGKTFKNILVGTNSITFESECGRKYEMHHIQDCCEDVYLEDVAGDIEDLLNTPITLAEEVTNFEDAPLGDCVPESYTWTYYKLATVKGYVSLRWFGESNGYYSEEVDIVEL